MNRRDPLERIADALERFCPAPIEDDRLDEALAFVWRVAPDRLHPVQSVNHVDIDLLVGVDHVRDILLANTVNFAAGGSANNALLWGARGMGKSSLVKAVHAKVAGSSMHLKLVEIQRGDIGSMGRLLDRFRGLDQQFILFCDDVSFSSGEEDYKSLKAVLEGGVEGRPHNVLFYATSNRRHLMPRDMIENERSTAINPSEAVEEKVSLSDRFGLWLGFHPCSQDDYLEMVKRYCAAYGVPASSDELVAKALEWQRTRGARSGRVAWQYFLHIAGAYGIRADSESRPRTSA